MTSADLQAKLTELLALPAETEWVEFKHNNERERVKVRILGQVIDDKYYKAMIAAYLNRFGKASREDIDKLLLDKLSDALSDDQKENFITNLLQEMRKEGAIRAEGSKRWAIWRLT